MTRVKVYDSVPQRWPTDAAYILAYVDGAFTLHNYRQAKELRPKAIVIGCTVTGRAGVKVADVERGDLTPREGVLWAHHELCRGRSPVVYCGTGTRETMLELSRRLGYGPLACDWWLADWDGRVEIPRGYVAHQYASNSAFDVSVAELGKIEPYHYGGG